MVKLLVLLALLAGPAQGAESKAEALMLAGRVQEALDAARVEAQAAPGDLDAQERYIDLLLTRRMAPLADSTYRERVASAPTDPNAHYLLGRAVTTAEEAQSEYEKALRYDPDHARSHMGMGAVHRALGALDASEAAYRRALSLDPSLSEAWAGLGVALVMQGKPEDALTLARQATSAVGDTSDPYIAIALLAPGEAEAVLAEGAARVPKDPRIPVTLAEVRLSKGDGPGAAAAAAAALKLAPGDIDALMLSMYAAEITSGALDAAGYRDLVASRQRSMEDPGGSLPGFDQLVSRYPKSALVVMGRAQPRAMTGNTGGAKADLETASRLDPTNLEVRASLGLLLAANGDAAGAVDHLRVAVDARPDDLSLVMALGRAEAATGATEVARERLSAAMAANPSNVDVLLAYVGVLAAARESEVAYRVLSDAVARGGDSRVVLALAAAARDVGKFEEAAGLVEELARRTGEMRLLSIADQLRQQGAAQP